MARAVWRYGGSPEDLRVVQQLLLRFSSMVSRISRRSFRVVSQKRIRKVSGHINACKVHNIPACWCQQVIS